MPKKYKEMEHFDIEKLKRKTPYELPENTFADMQRNVFQKIEIKKEAPIFNLKWIYAAAAVILLIVSANFIINFNKNDSLQSSQIATNVVVPQESNTAQTLVDTAQTPVIAKVEAPEIAQKETLNLTSAPISHQTNDRQIANTKVSKNVDFASAKLDATKMKTKIAPPTEAQIDEVLNGFSSAEIASLSNNSEQDVYLDLYN